MLSYRHGFHAGNHADVLKHWLLTLCIEYFKRKEKSFHVIDTHAGAGRYSLLDAMAQKNKEAETGILRLWQHRSHLPEVFAPYLTLMASDNSGQIRQYSGSPLIAMQLLRGGDRLRLVERHRSELKALKSLFAGKRHVDVIDGDGFQQLKAWLPPVTQRAITIIDPSYELKTDYDAVVAAIKESQRRFASGTYVIWYPMLANRLSEKMREQLKKLASGDWLDVTLQVQAKPEGHGMYGSGMFVFNPPWVLKEQLEEGMPVLAELLGGSEGEFTIDFSKGR